MSEELLPCPFCSSTSIANISETPVFHPTYFYIKCFDCDAVINSKESKNKAIEKWNKRVHEPARSFSSDNEGQRK